MKISEIEEIVSTPRVPRINRQRLRLKRGKPYAELVFLGDLHYGYSTCLVDEIVRQVNYCAAKNIYVLLMGDLIESGTRGSIGTSLFEQRVSPQQQLDEITEILKPLARKHLILGAYLGNHEERVFKDTGINPMKIICDRFRVPYLGAAGWNLFTVRRYRYKIYGLHGKSGARQLWTKIKAVNDVAQNVAPNAHVVAMGHVHENTVIERDYMDIKKNMLIQPKRFVILTGHYIGYDGSYAQGYGMSLGRMGSPKIKLFGDHFDIHASQ